MVMINSIAINKMLTVIKHARYRNGNVRCCSTTTEKPESSKYETVFSFPFIKYIAVLNRLKLYQILGTSAVIPGCGILEALNAIPSGALLSAAYIGLTGSALLSLASLPFRNTIGYIYISENNEKLKISSMDFWGRRKDRIISVDDWIPLLDLNPRKMDPIYLTPHLSDGTTYKLFIKFGHVLNPRKMGEYLE